MNPLRAFLRFAAGARPSSGAASSVRWTACNLPFALALLAAVMTLSGNSARSAQLKAFPPAIQLTSANARQRIVVQTAADDGITCDVTSQCALTLRDTNL